MTASASQSQDQGAPEDFSLSSTSLKPAQFRRIQEYLYAHTGINLQEGKQQLVKSRLGKRLRALKLDTFDEYFAYLEADRSGEEALHLVDVLTTNKTSFFREPEHLEFLRRHILPAFDPQDPVRIWSAGCSTGQEPYTVGMVLWEEWPDLERRDVRILATDICQQVLGRARQAVYGASELAGVAPNVIQKYFVREPADSLSKGAAGSGRGEGTQGLRGMAGESLFRVHPKVSGMVRFARLNLMEEWPMKGQFHVIFCRNVMIYFDKSTQERLVQRFWNLLPQGGYLFVGHSESLTSMRHEYRYVQPAVYSK